MFVSQLRCILVYIYIYIYIYTRIHIHILDQYLRNCALVGAVAGVFSQQQTRFSKTLSIVWPVVAAAGVVFSRNTFFWKSGFLQRHIYIYIYREREREREGERETYRAPGRPLPQTSADPWLHSLPTWSKACFFTFPYGAPLIDCGSHFLRICRRNRSNSVTMSWKIASEYGILTFGTILSFYCVLQTLVILVSSRNSFPPAKRASPEIWDTSFDW